MCQTMGIRSLVFNKNVYWRLTPRFLEFYLRTLTSGVKFNDYLQPLFIDSAKAMALDL